MLHELLFSLLGYSGDICTVMREGNSSADPKCRIKLISEKLPFITPCEIHLITQILEIAGSYVRLKDFIKKFTLPGSGSVYLSNLAFAMDEVLTEYRDMLASVEADLLETPSLGVTYILSKVEPYRSVLHNLCKILECSVKRFQQNKCILDCLVPIERSPTVNVIWHHLLRVFRSQLSEWLIFGSVNDPYGEFFINSDGEFIADKYPTILPPSLVNDILFAGKAVQKSDEHLSQKLEERFLERFEEIAHTDLLGDYDAEVEKVVHEIWEFISAERWRHMSEDYGLLEHLNLVRDVLLLGRGELFGSFFENLLVGGRYILDSPISTSATEVRNLSHAVNIAFLSAARSVGFDEERLTQRFKDLGNVEAFHEKFLADLESQSFMHYDQIFSLILQLLHECRKYCNSCTIQAKSAEIVTSFDHLAYNLFSALSAASAMTSSGATHLSQLILRLNFNNFFSGLSNYQSKPDTTIRLFDRGENYTVHFNDALFIAQNFYKNSGSVRNLTVGGRSVPSLLIPKRDKDIFRFILLSKQYRIELYSLENGGWLLSNQASPGNLTEMEDFLFSSESESEDSTLLSIFVKFSNDECIISLAFCHLEDHRFLIGQFVDSSLLPNLETAILQLGVKECIVPSGLLTGDANTSKLKNSDRPGHLPYLQLILERSNVLITELDKTEYFSSDPSDELNMLLKRGNASNVDIPNLFRASKILSLAFTNPTLESELVESFMCLGAIFKFLRLQSNEALFHTFTLSRFSLDNHVRLDSAALNALHLLPNSGGSVNKYDSVYGVLNHCRTPQGQRLLAQWLRQPLTDVAKINERLDLVEAFVEDSSLRHIFHETFLRRVPDLPRLARRLQMSKAKLQDVYRVYRVVGLMPEAISHLQRSENRHSDLLEHIFVRDLQTAAENFSKFMQMIESTLDLEAAKEGEYIIRSDFDDELQCEL
ncbi:unnamed protein product [Rodentolepis nana]|uniref:Gamma-tubulin complex component n=1 Tax=Rodentolepis nana TaxID=102285 RepID=A0A0R3TW98_RODNA|nr:unnamed protein product [Rodentolepis nana]